MQQVVDLYKYLMKMVHVNFEGAFAVPLWFECSTTAAFLMEEPHFDYSGHLWRNITLDYGSESIINKNFSINNQKSSFRPLLKC